MSFLEKIRSKPDKEKKKILWISLIVITFLLVGFWFLQLKNTLKNAKINNISLPTIDQKEIQESREGLREIRDGLNEMQEKMEETEGAVDEIENLEQTPAVSPDSFEDSL